jgi:choline dehydrogenase-like flavoprotein
MKSTFDIIIVGSGMGGGTLASAMAPSGARILILERGERLPKEPANWDAKSVFGDLRYATREDWSNEYGRPYGANAHYHVGGATKVFGAAMFRLRERDFEALETAAGTSPAWPFRYADLEPYYARAEALFDVHGSGSEDPSEPWRSSPYPKLPIRHDEALERIVQRMRESGLHPSHLPMALDDGEGGSCQRCATCDAFPCRLGAKNDAEQRAVNAALAYPNVQLLTGARVGRFLSSSGSKVDAVEVVRNGGRLHLKAGTFVLSAGAINSAKILLSSGHPSREGGLSNESGQVGRNLMLHVSTAIVSVDPRQRTPVKFQKTLAINDFYFGKSGSGYPLGSVQTLGKLSYEALGKARRWMPKFVADGLLKRSIEFVAMTEDLPDPENRVALDGASLRIRYVPNNLASHRSLLKEWRNAMRAIDRPIMIAQSFGKTATTHQCGTVRMGSSPGDAAIDQFCRSFEVSNLFVVDGSFFPSSSAVNPSLTIAAQALRVADHLVGQKIVSNNAQHANQETAFEQENRMGPYRGQ